MTLRYLALAVLASWVVGCGGDSTKLTDGGPDSDSDTDTDTDTETGTDTDTGTGTGTGTDTDCVDPEVDCGGVCVDLSTDEDNCGDCGRACGEGTTCEAGQCMCGGVQCLPGESCIDDECACVGGRVDCGDVCADLSSDVDNCGSCGFECPRGGLCNSGRCECPEGQVNCGDYCADLSSDRANCGGCGDWCGGECESGMCDCGAMTECALPGWMGGGTICTDTAVDPINCGRCGAVCGGGGDPRRFCRDGVCECQPGLTACDVDRGGWIERRCVDTDASDEHCGACDTPCPGVQVCSGGACIDACPEGADACDRSGDGDREPDYCTDFEVDPLNCGACANEAPEALCDMREVCVAGECSQWMPAHGCDACGDCDYCPPSTACCAYPGEAEFAICVFADVCP